MIFFQYFSNLKSGECAISQDTGEAVFNKLDENFSEEEISEQIHRLKKGKAPGTDGLLNEMFLKCDKVLLPILKKLFN